MAIIRKNIGLIWARGNGSSLPRKNIYPLLGRPLISYILTAAKSSQVVDRLYVFTEDYEIADITSKSGWQVIPRLKHMVEYDHPQFNRGEINIYQNRWILKDLGASPEEIEAGKITPFVKGLFHFNCNHCLISAATIKGMHDTLLASKVSRICVASAVDPHLFIVHGEDSIAFPIWHQQGLDRRDYPPLYRIYPDTNFILIDRLQDNNKQTIYSIPPEEAIDVHDIHDIRLAEFYLQQRETEKGSGS
jgi:N-acylneuraminate cytidylyltransferase